MNKITKKIQKAMKKQKKMVLKLKKNYLALVKTTSNMKFTIIKIKLKRPLKLKSRIYSMASTKNVLLSSINQEV